MARHWAVRAGLAGALGCGSSASAPGADGGAASSEASIPPGDATTLANGADGAGDDQSDSGPTGSADSGAPAGFPPMFTKFGTVGARWRHNPDGGDVTDIEALFVDYGAAGTACTSVSVGACVRLHCPGPDGGGEDPNADPGTMEIGSPPAQVTLTYPGPNEGQGSSPDKLLWPPGTSIPITSSGSADVPAWSTAVTLPSMATVTVPGMIRRRPLDPTAHRRLCRELDGRAGSRGGARAPRGRLRLARVYVLGRCRRHSRIDARPAFSGNLRSGAIHRGFDSISAPAPGRCEPPPTRSRPAPVGPRAK